MAASLRSIVRARALRDLKRARAAARKVRWPRGFHGAVMWCPACQYELARIPDGETLSQDSQQSIVDAHRAVCRAVQ